MTLLLDKGNNQWELLALFRNQQPARPAKLGESDGQLLAEAEISHQLSMFRIYEKPASRENRRKVGPCLPHGPAKTFYFPSKVAGILQGFQKNALYKERSIEVAARLQNCLLT